MDTIGDRIINLRDMKDMTQVRLSKMIGVTKSTMSKYENNLTIPNADILGKIADALNTTADYLIGRTNNYSPLNKNEKWVRLDEQEDLFLEKFSDLNFENKVRILERLDTMLEGQIKKSDVSSYGGILGYEDKELLRPHK